VLYRLLDETDRTIETLRRERQGHERDLAVADFEDDYRRIDDVLTELVGPPEDDELEPIEPPAAVEAPGVVGLQLSWMPGRVVAWAAGPGVRPEDTDGVRERLTAAGVVSLDAWDEHRSVKLPDGSRADALSAPLGSVLGWLVALGATRDDDTIGASVTWLGLVTAWAVRLAAQGRMVPQLKEARRNGGDAPAKGAASAFEVRWAPALVDEAELTSFVDSLPGSVTTFENRRDGRAFTQAVVADLLDAICRQAAAKLEVPAPPPQPRTKSDVAESFLARLDGTLFEAPSRVGTDLGRHLSRWARPVTGISSARLIVQLDPPDELGAWYLAVLAPHADGHLEPVEAALVTATQARREDVKHQLTRLERLFPELLRPGAKRRGEVVLSQDEAWELMTSTGDTLTAAGFDVRVPALSRRKPTPALRLTSEDAEESVVGAQQLANVRWSAVFDDIELTAEEIARLAAQATPLVRSRGQWVELDRADLAQAAAALAERSDATQLTGAEMLRHALGLEGSPLAGGISITGDGWAADLLRSASDIPDELPTKPEGFHGELRSYQAEARAWLSFLDRAGLGGCLALDMGLGKTPTLLAHLNETTGEGPALVVAPPAVVGNWAAEAQRFVPDLKVTVHHGASRAGGTKLAKVVEKADVIITTYGTAVRDIDDLEKIEWATVVLDEAQAIKNPASETAQQLRRLPARTRVALTGTPIENGLGDLWAIMDFTNPGLVGARAPFIAQLSQTGDGKGGAEQALRALNGILVFRRTKAEPAIAAELPDRIDELDHCTMTPEQIGLYQAVLDKLVVATTTDEVGANNQGAVLAAITALKQVCNHPAAYQSDDKPLDGRSGKLTRLNEIVDAVFAAGERVLIFTHFASWGEKLATYLSERTGVPIACYHGGLARGARDKLVDEFQKGEGAGAMVLSLKAGGTGLNLTAASHVVLYDRWWNPAVEDQARDRVWRIGQKNTVICHRLVCPGTVDERVEEVFAGKRKIADLVLPKSSSIDDLDAHQLQIALGIDPDTVLAEDPDDVEAGAAA
jgi:superfamily II DNA or RNA helicase